MPKASMPGGFNNLSDRQRATTTYAIPPSTSSRDIPHHKKNNNFDIAYADSGLFISNTESHEILLPIYENLISCCDT